MNENIKLSDHDEATKVLLNAALEVSVPLRIGELMHCDRTYFMERARECGQYIAEHGDVILYKSEKKGETAKAFNHLVDALAILSFAPGGVKFLDMQWESKL